MICPECGLEKKPGHHECECGHVFVRTEYESRKYRSKQVRRAFVWGFFGIFFGIFSLQISHSTTDRKIINYISIFILCIGLINAVVGIVRLVKINR